MSLSVCGADSVFGPDSLSAESLSRYFEGELKSSDSWSSENITFLLEVLSIVFENSFLIFLLPVGLLPFAGIVISLFDRSLFDFSLFDLSTLDTEGLLSYLLPVCLFEPYSIRFLLLF